MNDLQRAVARNGAFLFLSGMLTGLWAGATLTGKVKVPLPHLALAAHLNGILGGLWLIAMASTLPHLAYSPIGAKRLATATLVPAYGAWFITLIASFIGARGLEMTGDPANDVIAVLLLAMVVAPTLVICSAWAYGLAKRQRSESPLGGVR
jgi:(hydroxyamino)benzene mutase